MEYYNEALNIFENLPNYISHTQSFRDRAHAYRHFAKIREIQGRLVETQKYYSMAITIFHDIGDQSAEAACQRHLRRLAKELGYQRVTSRHFHRMANALSRLKDGLGRAIGV